MRIHPQTAVVVGPVNSNRWCQVLVLPQAYGVIQVRDPSGNALVRGISLLTQLTNLLQVVSSEEELIKSVEKLLTDTIESLVLLVPFGSSITVVSRGDGVVYLKRGNTIAKLIDGIGEITGEIKAGDIAIMTTSASRGVLTEEIILSAFDHLPAKDVAEKLTLKLHESSAGAIGAAALLFEVKDIIPHASGSTDIDMNPRTGIYMQLKSMVRRYDRFGVARRIKRRVRWVKNIRFSKRKLVVAATLLVCLIVFVASIVFGMQKKLYDTKGKEIEAALKVSQQAFDEGVALIELNPRESRERLNNAKSTLAPFVNEQFSGTKEGKKAKVLYEKVIDNLTLAMQIIRVEPQEYFDVSLLKSGSVVTGISIREGLVGIFDGNGTVFSLVLPVKRAAIAAGGGVISEATSIAAGGDALYILTDSSVYEVDPNGDNKPKSVISDDNVWGVIGATVTYAGNVYLADKTNNRIWKYIAREKGFSDRKEYLNPDTLPDLSQATSMAIDGSVWLATADTRIIRFTQGRENTYVVRDVEPPLQGTLYIYTDDESQKVYVLEPEGKRVVVLDKDGLYVAQYVWSSDMKPTSFVVSEKEKLILLVSQGKVYSITLK